MPNKDEQVLNSLYGLNLIPNMKWHVELSMLTIPSTSLEQIKQSVNSPINDKSSKTTNKKEKRP